MNDLARYIPEAPRSPAELKDQIQQIKRIQKDLMIPDVHYGKIPGTSKPTLYKAGAELLLTTFRIAVDPDIEDLSTDDEIRYRIKLRGVAGAEIRMGDVSGHVVGVGIGEASSSEEKYKWRKAVCDEEFEATSESRRRVVYKHGRKNPDGSQGHYTIQQVRTNPSDQANTVLKMAKKRAQVDLCLTGLAASDVFDQDLDDLPEELIKERTSAKAGTSRPQRTQGDGVATEAQVRLLEAKLFDKGVKPSSLAEAMGIAKIEELPFDKVNDALSWISNQEETNGTS